MCRNIDDCVLWILDARAWHSSFYQLFEEKVGIGLPLMEEFSIGSQLSLRFGVLW